MATIGQSAPSSNTINYDALLSTTLFNYRRTLEDAISKTNAVMWYLRNKVENGYKKITDIGERMQIQLMYELGQADSYSGYDVLDTTPMEGITSAFFEWRQAATPIAISALEEKKNAGEARMINLLEGKTKQAELGIQEFFNKRFLVGAGGSSITSPYTSPVNGSSFIDPLPLLIHSAPTSAATVGNLAQNSYSWWQNQVFDFTSITTYAGFLNEMRKLRIRCGRGPGGQPDVHFTDENVYAFYEAALASKHQNPSYQKADIPFENVAFYGQPVTYDQLVPDAKAGSETVSTTSGTWYMINSQFMQVQVHADTDFAPTPFVRPNGQDAKVAHILWLGGIGVSNRRKFGVGIDIDTTIAA